MVIKFTFIILSIFLFFGCIEKSGYYTHEEESIISLICDTLGLINLYPTMMEQLTKAYINSTETELIQ